MLGSTFHLRDTTRVNVSKFIELQTAAIMAPLALASPVYHQHSMRMGLARNQARNHNETTTKPLTKPLVFSHIINETGGFYKQLIYSASIIFIRDAGFEERVRNYRWFRYWLRCGVEFVLTVRPFCVIQVAVLSICA